MSGSTTSTLSTAASSGLRNEPCMVMCRSSENLTASASIGSPSWNLTPGRSLMDDVLAVRRRSRGTGELRHDVELLVDVEELVAERREHDAADIGARERRIEHVRILGEADAQRRLRARGADGGRSAAAAEAGASRFIMRRSSILWISAPRVRPSPDPCSSRAPPVAKARTGARARVDPPSSAGCGLRRAAGRARNGRRWRGRRRRRRGLGRSLAADSPA